MYDSQVAAASSRGECRLWHTQMEFSSVFSAFRRRGYCARSCPSAASSGDSLALVKKKWRKSETRISGFGLLEPLCASHQPIKSLLLLADPGASRCLAPTQELPSAICGEAAQVCPCAIRLPCGNQPVLAGYRAGSARYPCIQCAVQSDSISPSRDMRWRSSLTSLARRPTDKVPTSTLGTLPYLMISGRPIHHLGGGIWAMHLH